MGMGIVSDEEFDLEHISLNVPTPLTPSVSSGENEGTREESNSDSLSDIKPNTLDDTEIRDKQSIDFLPPSTQGSTRIQTIKRGRGNQLEVPNNLRKIISEESAINGRASALSLAKSFGLSPSSVSAYAHGSTSTKSYDTPDKAIVDNTNDAKLRVSKKARNRLIKALNHITDENLEGAKVRDLAGVAKDMSAIIKNMEPDAAHNDRSKNGPTFVLYAPQIKSEESFEVIQAKE